MKITEDIEIIEFYLTSFIEKFGIDNDDWTDENTITVTKGIGKKAKAIGTIKLDHDKLDIVGEEVEAFFAEMIKKKEEKEKKKITPELVEKSPFKKLLSSTSYYGGMHENYDSFMELSEMLTKIGISEVKICEHIDAGSSANKKLTLHMDCSIQGDIKENFEEGYESRLKEYLFTNFKHTATSKSGMSISNSGDKGFFFNIDSEKVDKIEVGGMLFGKYYRERNIILLTFNPFIVKKMSKLSTEIPDIFTKLVELITELNPETVDTKDFAKKQFMASFIKGSINALRNNKDKLKKYATKELELEASFRETINLRIEAEREVIHIEKNIKLGGAGILEELAQTELLPFIEKIELDTANILMKFKPTCLKINELDLENGKTFGKRTFYLGSLTFRISPSDIQIKTDIEVVRAHPHSNGSGNSWAGCCFGDTGSDGRRKLFEMLAMNKFSEVAKMLWFWIKTYINGAAYSHHNQYYTELLTRGVPVWDENGERILINDPNRLKTGEQVTMSKNSIYETNFKKLAEVQIC